MIEGMLYDAYGRELREKELARRLVEWEPQDRLQDDASRALTPRKLDEILLAANRGDPVEQSRLAGEILEKDWDTAQAVQTRTLAATGVPWRCKPTAKGVQYERAAAEAQEMLAALEPERPDDLDFNGLLNALLGGLLPGYSLAETIWAPGGRHVVCFSEVRRDALTFYNSREPRILSRENPGEGAALTPAKFIFHRHQARSGDTTRGGLIRPLGWMYVFAAEGIRSLMRYTEKVGFPFVFARIDDSAWDDQRAKVASLIRNFGRDGGAVFTKNVELELLERNASNDDLYFKLLEYFGNAKTRVVLGQTATSGDAGGFSKGQAQSQVRQDLLESDCRTLGDSIRRDVLMPWAGFRYGRPELAPQLEFETSPPEDQVEKSTVLMNLRQAGFEIDADWVSAEFGIPVTASMSFASPGGRVPLAENEKKKTSHEDPKRSGRW